MIARFCIKKWLVPTAVMFFVICLAFNTAGHPHNHVRLVVIDAGHGGKDPGTHGKSVKEKDITLKIALQLGRLIKTYLKDVKVIYTRKSDHFVELHDRADIANRNHADVFISIHCNSNPRKIDGSETYVMGLHTSEGNLEVAKRENSVILQENNYLEKYDGFDPKSPLAHIIFSNMQNAFQANSLKLAQSIENQFHIRMGRPSRGVRQAGFLVLWKTAMPSVLVEAGYLTNRKDEKFLKSEKGQIYIASAIYRALREYKEEVEQLK